MMEALRVMTYFKVSLSTCNWDSALHKGEVHRRPLSGEEGQIGIERGANSGVSLALPCQRED